MVADAVGTQILTVVSVHKPGKFPARVFYTRRWRDPDGVEFGKTHLRVTVMQSFRTIVRGYRHDYRMATEHNKLERTTEKSMTSVQRPAEAEVNTFSEPQSVYARYNSAELEALRRKYGRRK